LQNLPNGDMVERNWTITIRAMSSDFHHSLKIFAMRLTVRALSFLLVISLVGCGTETKPQVVEGNSIQDFLDANPDYEDESTPDSEEEEFASSEDE
jgi:hypothetical protein